MRYLFELIPVRRENLGFRDEAHISPVILDHYAEVLYALKEYDLAFFYWNLALQKNDDEIEGLQEKIQKRKEALK